jgi:hypothetical protein
MLVAQSHFSFCIRPGAHRQGRHGFNFAIPANSSFASSFSRAAEEEGQANARSQIDVFISFRRWSYGKRKAL